MLFSELSLATPILRALEQEGYTTPTPIQSKAIPPALSGRDVLGCAQTGTGKTAAFALPILHRLFSAPADVTQRGPVKARALVLSPTRELASQIAESFASYGRETGLSHTVIFGGVSQFHQERALRKGVDIIVATPGRLIDLMDQRLVDLSGITSFVLDEADRMLDMGFIQPIRRIAAATPSTRQTLLFSATMPREITSLAESLLKNPVRVSVSPVSSAAPRIEQSVFMVNRDRKQPLLERMLRGEGVSRAVVFTKTKHGAERVGKKLARAGIQAETIHGDKAQNQRKRALDRFKSGAARVLVATDVAARGLDVDDITHVFNYDLPMEAEAYVHRIGRTARAGASGVAFAFCDAEERGLLRDIERLIGSRLRVDPTPDLPATQPEPREERIQGARNAPVPAHRMGHGVSVPHAHRARAGNGSGHGPGTVPSAGSGAGHQSPDRPPHALASPQPRRRVDAGAGRGWKKPSRRSSW